MKSILLGVFSALLLSTTPVQAKPDKIPVCHVGSQLGPGGETYDPACMPGEENDYFCPDAGKIDLIFVPETAALAHLGDPSHSWDGMPDYLPAEVGADGVSNEDTDADGIDEGCEPDPCPCFDLVPSGTPYGFISLGTPGQCPDGSTVSGIGTEFDFDNGSIVYVDKTELCNNPTLYSCSSTLFGFILLSVEEYALCSAGPGW